MNIPYYRFIDEDCQLLHSKDNIDELVLKLLSNKISDEEYREFINVCLKANLKENSYFSSTSFPLI